MQEDEGERSVKFANESAPIDELQEQNIENWMKFTGMNKESLPAILNLRWDNVDSDGIFNNKSTINSMLSKYDIIMTNLIRMNYQHL